MYAAASPAPCRKTTTSASCGKPDFDDVPSSKKKGSPPDDVIAQYLHGEELGRVPPDADSHPEHTSRDPLRCCSRRMRAMSDTMKAGSRVLIRPTERAIFLFVLAMLEKAGLPRE